MGRLLLSNAGKVLWGYEGECPEELTVPDGVETIEKYAFEEAKTLKKVLFSPSVQTIKENAFSKCAKLESAIFQNGAAQISDSAFEGCKKTKLMITCPANSQVEEYVKAKKFKVAKIEIKKDATPAVFSYTISKQNVKITGYNSLDDKVIIPGYIDGYLVTSVSKDAFKNNKLITSVIWPSEIPVIPKEIFFGCSFLKEVVLPEGVTEISERAFRNCESLIDIVIPSSVEKIHDKAFECAKNTADGWIYWNCITTIRGNKDSYAATFAQTAGFNFIALDASDEEQEVMSLYRYHEVADGIALDDFVITEDMPMVTTRMWGTYSANFEIPNEILGKPVVELSAEFHKSKMLRGTTTSEYESIAETLIIPGNLKRIRCPLQNRGIKNVIISPDNASIIFDDYAWYEDAGKTIVGAWDKNGAFYGRYGLSEYTIMDGAEQACADMSQRFFLKKIVVPSTFNKTHEKFLCTDQRKTTVEKIYANSDSCMREYAAEIGAEFVALDDQDIKFSADGSVLISCPQLYSVPVYSIPDTVRYIEKHAFKGNEYIKEIIIPDTVEEIGEGAFAECLALERIVLPNMIDELPDKLCFSCNQLSEVKMPKHVTRIGAKCFANTLLKEINLPDTVAEIGDYAFATMERWRSNSINAIELPKSVRKLGISVCAGINNITIYDSIDPFAKPAKEFYDDENGVWNSTLGSIGIRQWVGYVRGACSSNIYSHTIIVKSSEYETIKYKVLMYGDEEARDVYCAMVSSWGKNADFNFERIDEKFSKLKEWDNKLITVTNRLKYPVDLTEQTKEKYISWIKKNKTEIVNEFIKHGDLGSLITIEEYKIIDKKNIREFIELSVQEGKEEIHAFLLEYSSTLK